ncbi:unnamed protein product [Arctogadus glacialis]
MGPLKGFLEALGKLQKRFFAKGQRMDCPIHTYLVTAHGGYSGAGCCNVTKITFIQLTFWLSN